MYIAKFLLTKRPPFEIRISNYQQCSTILKGSIVIKIVVYLGNYCNKGYALWGDV